MIITWFSIAKYILAAGSSNFYWKSSVLILFLSFILGARIWTYIKINFDFISAS